MARNPDNWMPTRRSLLSRLKNVEDQESWSDFYHTYRRLVHGVAVKAGLAESEASDVVQETFIAVAKRMPEFRYDPTIGSFKSWLLHTTRWKIADQFRRRNREPQARERPSKRPDETATIEQVPDPAGDRLEEIWDAEWEKNIMDRALEKVRRAVKASQYQIFDLYVIKRWPVQKVAQELGVSPGRVYLAKHRVSALIKKEIEEMKRKSA